MPLIQTPDIARKLMRGLRLTTPPDSVLAPETVSVIIVEDYSAPLTGVSFGCFGSVTQAPIAAEFSLVTLRRIPQMRVKVTKVHVGVDTDTTILISNPVDGVAGLVVSANTQFTDFSVPGRPSAVMGSDTQVAIPTRRDLIRIPALAGVTYSIELDIDLGDPNVAPADDMIMAAAGLVNARLDCSWEWIEGPVLG